MVRALHQDLRCRVTYSLFLTVTTRAPLIEGENDTEGEDRDISRKDEDKVRAALLGFSCTQHAGRSSQYVASLMVKTDANLCFGPRTL